MEDAILRILAKLKEVRKRGLESFGCESHKFVLEKPLRETEVLEFERQYGIQLPEDFRRFVLEAGSSGAGPYYGLLPIDRWGAEHCSDPTGAAKECPMYPGMPAPDPDATFDEAGTSLLQRGTIWIVTQGCAYETVLVVSGPYRGRLVNLNEEGGTPYFTRDNGFLAWYERWLDEMLAGWDTDWFGFGMPGDAGRMIEVLTATTSTADERLDAVRTVLRMPSLMEPLASVVRDCLYNSEGKIRSMSADLAAKHRMFEATGRLRELCDDAEANVRRKALRALHRIGDADWPAHARRHLNGDDDDVAFTSLSLLLKSELVTKEMLLPLIAGPGAKRRRMAIWAWGKSGWTVSDAPWLEARIHDEDREVRRSVILAASESDDRAFAPRLREMTEREGGEFDLLVANVGRNLRKWPLRRWAYRITSAALRAFFSTNVGTRTPSN